MIIVNPRKHLFLNWFEASTWIVFAGKSLFSLGTICSRFAGAAPDVFSKRVILALKVVSDLVNTGHRGL